MRYSASFAGLLAAAALGYGQAKLPEGVTLQKDIVYGDHERQKFDLYTPKGDGPFPLVLWVHGGGWAAGSKDAPPVVLMTAKGFAVASMNYRFSQQAVFPAQIHDVKAVVRLLRANAEKYKLDPDRFGAAGASAGGHLVALLGTTGNVKELEGKGGNEKVSSKVQAIVDVFGPTDMTSLAPGGAKNAVTQLFGGNAPDKADLYKLGNPIPHIDKDCPPFLILHGDEDKIVPLNQSELLKDALEKAKIPVEMVVVKGAGHDGKVAGGENALKIADFFEKHLKPKK